MGFFWLCPCGSRNFYHGSKTTDAITTCKACKHKSRVFQYIVVPKATPKPQITTEEPQPIIVGDLTLGADFNKTVLIAGLMSTIQIYKNKVLSREGKILKQNSIEGKKVLEWVETYDSQKPVPMLVVHQAYFQKVDLAYKELKKLRE